MDWLSEAWSLVLDVFSWATVLVKGAYAAISATSFYLGLVTALGSTTIPDALLVMMAVMLVASVLHSVGVLNDGVFKFFIGMFLLVFAYAVVCLVVSGFYWLAFSLVLTAVLVLAACAQLDPSVLPLLIDVLDDAVSFVASIVDAAVSAATNLLSSLAPLLPWALLGLAGWLILTSDDGDSSPSSSTLQRNDNNADHLSAVPAR